LQNDSKISNSINAILFLNFSYFPITFAPMSEKKSMPDLNRLSVQDFQQATKTPIVIVLDNVRSMNNVGSVFRTADGFALEAIYLCGFTPQPPHRDIQKTALGATETVQWQHVQHTLDAVQTLQQNGYTIIAIEQVHNSISLEKYVIDKTKKYALILGNEVEGIEETVIKKCDAVIEIPQAGTKHSFNISVSMGIVSWHFYHNMILS
jgi:23S rRNA (guanosine2251-2'-O)-methyltransferase